MKKSIPLLTIVAALVFFGSASRSNAWAGVGFMRDIGYQPTGEDGITASPKMRQLFDERAAMNQTNSNAMPVNGPAAGPLPFGDEGIAASPKIRQMLNEEDASVYAQIKYDQMAFKSAGYRATGDDGVTASPKMRQMLNEQGQAETQVAPLK